MAITRTVKRAADRCITATLLRGRVYVFKNVMYQRGVSVVVPEGLAFELEELHEEVVDSDNEKVEKPVFRINYDATTPSAAPNDENAITRPRGRRIDAPPPKDDKDKAPIIRPRKRRLADG